MWIVAALQAAGIANQTTLLIIPHQAAMFVVTDEGPVLVVTHQMTLLVVTNEGSLFSVAYDVALFGVANYGSVLVVANQTALLVIADQFARLPARAGPVMITDRQGDAAALVERGNWRLRDWPELLAGEGLLGLSDLGEGDTGYGKYQSAQTSSYDQYQCPPASLQSADTKSPSSQVPMLPVPSTTLYETRLSFRSEHVNRLKAL